MRLTITGDRFELVEANQHQQGPCNITTRLPNILILKSDGNHPVTMSFIIGIVSPGATRFPGQLVYYSEQIAILLHEESKP